jgi:hypothetical protein
MKVNSENMKDMIFLKSFSENLGGVRQKRDLLASNQDTCFREKLEIILKSSCFYCEKPKIDFWTFIWNKKNISSFYASWRPPWRYEPAFKLPKMLLQFGRLQVLPMFASWYSQLNQYLCPKRDRFQTWFFIRHLKRWFPRSKLIQEKKPVSHCVFKTKSVTFSSQVLRSLYFRNWIKVVFHVVYCVVAWTIY